MQYIYNISSLRYLILLNFFKLEVKEAQLRTANGHQQLVVQQQAHALILFALMLQQH